MSWTLLLDYKAGQSLWRQILWSCHFLTVTLTVHSAAPLEPTHNASILTGTITVSNNLIGVYAIEATCHAPRREDVYGEIFRVLKPGQVFACYEWCLTPKYDPSNELHRLIKKKIEEGDGLPDMASQEYCTSALTSVGFEVRKIINK